MIRKQREAVVLRMVEISEAVMLVGSQTLDNGTFEDAETREKVKEYFENGLQMLPSVRAIGYDFIADDDDVKSLATQLEVDSDMFKIIIDVVSDARCSREVISSPAAIALSARLSSSELHGCRPSISRFYSGNHILAPVGSAQRQCDARRARRVVTFFHVH